MDRILIILKKENGPRASSAPALGLNTIIFKYVYWYMKQISGERLQDHWSSGLIVQLTVLEALEAICFVHVPTNILDFSLAEPLFALDECSLFGGVNTNPVLGVSNQAHHKLACRATDEGKNRAILNLKSKGFYNLSRDARKPGSGFPARSCTNWPVR